MSFSSDLTESDISLIVAAFHRQNDHIRGIRSEDNNLYGETLNFPVMVERAYSCEHEQLASKCFLLGSRHYLPELLTQQDLYDNSFLNISPYHDFERRILNEELEFFEKDDEEQYDCILLDTAAGVDLPEISPEALLRQLLCLQQYMHLIPHNLKAKLEEMDSIRRLSWIVNLLLDFHFGNECNIYVSISIKLCLSALQILRYSYSSNNARTFMLKFDHYFQMIQRNQCCEHILAYALKVFNVCPEMCSEMKKDFFLHVEDMKYVIESGLKVDFRMRDLLNHQEVGRLKNLDLCFALNFRNFITLIEYGVQSAYIKKDWEIMERRGVHVSDRKLLNMLSENCVTFYGRRIELRTYQIIRLFSMTKHSEKPRCRAEYMLKLLWAAIPDPFLSEEEVRFCVRQRFRYPNVETELLKAWQWYKKLILNRMSPKKSPRCLKHLSRCAIRQALGGNMHLPHNVQSLQLPITLIDYLLLKECGNNPYAEDFMKNNLLRLYSNVEEEI